MTGLTVDDGEVRRALAGALIGLGLVLGSLTLSGWWARETVLEPERTEEVADAVLGNDTVRRELARRVVGAVAATLPPEATGPAELFRDDLEDALASPAMVAPFRLVVVDVHRALLGETAGPVVIDPATVATAVSAAVPGLDPALLGSLPAVRFDVPKASPMATAKDRLPGLLRAGLWVSLALVAAGFLVDSRHDRALVRIGWWLLGASVAQLFLLYLVPVLLVPAMVDNAWTGLVAEVATASWGPLVGLLAAMAVAGLGCLVLGFSWKGLRRAQRVGARRGASTGAVPVRAATASGPAPTTTFRPGTPPPPPPERAGGWRL